MYIIVLISFVLLCIKIASKISNKNFEEIFVIGYILYTAIIILTGYILSELTIWDSPVAWSVLPFLLAICFHSFFTSNLFQKERTSISSFKVTGRAIQRLHEVYIGSSKTEKVSFAILLISFLLIHSIQLSLTFYTPPNEWDSMTGHLNRIFYFLQNGSFKHFIGTNWNIDTYPKAFSSIQVYPFLMSNWNEHFFKLPNMSAYWILFIGSYGVLKRLLVPFVTRIFCSSLLLFIPIAIIQSTSTDTDIVLAAYLISIVYFLFSFSQTQKTIYIYLSVLAFSIALSHKITFVFSFIPLAIILIYIFINLKSQNWKFQIKHAFLAGIIFLSTITMPTGYLSNYVNYGHPIGPKTATQHQSIERAGNLYKLMEHGTRNLIRYQFDLLNLDGLRNIDFVEKSQKNIKVYFQLVDQKFNLGLENETSFTIIPFSFNRRLEFYNGTPIYGIIFIIFCIPSILYLRKRDTKKIYYYFFAAYIFHLIALAYTAAYDPWKGRYMLSTLVFIIPIIANWLTKKHLFQRNHLGKVFLILSSLLISLTGLSTILLHLRALPFGTNVKQSIFNMTRIKSLTISRPDISDAYANFENLVPENATVALGTVNDDYEYPLWGPNFSRRLIPINPFEQGLQEVPQEADYLFFAKSVIKPQSGDIRLGTNFNMSEGVIVRGEDYYLRKLK